MTSPGHAQDERAPSRTVVLAAGCFWCLDSVARRVKGVTSVRSVYTGGSAASAHYLEVASGRTEHAEAVEITFDPDVLPTSVLFEIFFSVHDPTSLNRQGYDVGPQYRSAMFYSAPEEEAEFRAAIEEAQSFFSRDIVTTLEPLGAVYEAESEHQNFHQRQPDVGYCQVIIDPKVRLLRSRWPSWLREESPA